MRVEMPALDLEALMDLLLGKEKGYRLVPCPSFGGSEPGSARSNQRLENGTSTKEPQ